MTDDKKVTTTVETETPDKRTTTVETDRWVPEPKPDVTKVETVDTQTTTVERKPAPQMVQLSILGLAGLAMVVTALVADWWDERRHRLNRDWTYRS